MQDLALVIFVSGELVLSTQTRRQDGEILILRRVHW
jgi:hypothetical protein